ncbi:MAG TPA: sulfur carrier protein ThiS [Burkholderiaceae bacterium]|jgi:sulfur carrier protein|nr:sulfur carrier protein ThiS [Burkholderiaceae bacterium]
MDISLNGQRVDVAAATLQELLQQRGYEPGAAIACAINQQFVPRAQWAQRELNSGDRVDVVAPITGG